MLSEFLGSLWFFFPAAVANMAPIFASKIFGEGTPVDGGKKWRGKPILGSHKTWQGFIWGTLLGGMFFVFQLWLNSEGILTSWDVVGYSNLPIWLGFPMAFGALFGDSVKSFFKRRSSVKPGNSWMPWDQLDFVIGAILFTIIFVNLPLYVVLVFLIVYPLLTVVTSLIGYYSGLRKDKF